MARKPKSRARSPLYRMIAVGQKMHRALLAPALARGLEPGDDALLYLLATQTNPTAVELAAETGLSPEALRKRLGALIERDLVVLSASGPKTMPQMRLTARGARLEAWLAEHWLGVEETLFEDLKPRERKSFNKQLKQLLEKLGD
jgi:DNA-binding MarR family transcriptional regulator